MGVIGKIFKTIFNPSVPSVQSQVPTVTARDLVPETTSNEPEAPVFGSDNKNKREVQVPYLFLQMIYIKVVCLNGWYWSCYR